MTGPAQDRYVTALIYIVLIMMVSVFGLILGTFRGISGDCLSFTVLVPPSVILLLLTVVWASRVDDELGPAAKEEKNRG